jgi:hypothetical protein
MTPSELDQQLDRLAGGRLPYSVMIWGAPGIGKSSIVGAVAERHGLDLIDLRLSQLAPTDLRGLPVAEDGRARWYPPEFLPQDGQGILFLDEINMAPPTMQGVAQQLVLDRRVGSYKAPDGWLIWAAGNRAIDRAAVFDMPAPLANRFVHFEVETDLASFRSWGISTGLNERIAAFLAFRPALLHMPSHKVPAWPSPRSWAMASKLMAANVPIRAAVGEAAQVEFDAFCAVYNSLPDLDAIVQGLGGPFTFPSEMSARYAVVIGLGERARTADAAMAALDWLISRAEPEWVQLLLGDCLPVIRGSNQFAAFAKLAREHPVIRAFLTEERDVSLS